MCEGCGGRRGVGTWPSLVGRQYAGNSVISRGGLPTSRLADVKSLEGGDADEMMRFHQIRLQQRVKGMDLRDTGRA